MAYTTKYTGLDLDQSIKFSKDHAYLDSTLNTIQTNLDSLSRRLVGNENLSSEISGLKTRISALESVSVGGTISEIQTKLLELQESISDIKISGSEEIYTNIISLGTRLNDLNSKIDNIDFENDLLRISERVSILEARGENPGSGGGSYDDTFLRGEIVTLKSQVLDLYSKVYNDSELRGLISGLQEDVRRLQENSPSTDDSELRRLISELQEEVSKLSPYDDSGLREEISEIKEDISKLSPYDDTEIKREISNLREDISNINPEYDDSEIKRLISDLESTIEDLDVKDQVSSLEEKLGNEFRIWQGDDEFPPSLNGEPANGWTNKSEHIGDFYITTEGYCYKFTKNLDWELVEDRYIVPYASKIDTKSRIFTSQPTDQDEYNPGDLWIGVTNQEEGYYRDTLICTNHKNQGDTFDFGDWELTYLGGRVSEDSGIKVLEKREDLLLQETWTNERGELTVHKGVVVSIPERSSEKEGSLYILCGDDYQNQNSWVEINNKLKISWNSLTNVPSEVTTLGGTLTDVTSRIGTNESGIEKLNTDFQDLSDSVGTIKTESLPEIQEDIVDINSRLEGQFYIWQGKTPEKPGPDNYPESAWEESEKQGHVGDFFVTSDGVCYKYSSSFEWESVTDRYVISYTSKIDTKATVFTEMPDDSYKIGDFWIGATYSGESVTYLNEILICISNPDSEFSIDDWQPLMRGDSEEVDKSAVNLGGEQTITGVKTLTSPLYFGNLGNLFTRIRSTAPVDGTSGLFIEVGKSSSTTEGSELTISNSTGGKISILSNLDPSFLSDDIGKSGEISIESVTRGNINIKSGNLHKSYLSGGQVDISSSLLGSGSLGVNIDPDFGRTGVYKKSTSGLPLGMSKNTFEVSGFDGLTLSSSAEKKSRMNGVVLDWTPDVDGNYNNLDIHRVTYDETSNSLIPGNVKLTINGVEVLTESDNNLEDSVISFNRAYLKDLDYRALQGTLDISEYLQKAVDDAIGVGAKLLIDRATYLIGNPIYINPSKELEIDASGATFICPSLEIDDFGNDYSFDTEEIYDSSFSGNVGEPSGSMFIIPGSFIMPGETYKTDIVMEFTEGGYIDITGEIHEDSSYKYTDYIELPDDIEGDLSYSEILPGGEFTSEISIITYYTEDKELIGHSEETLGENCSGKLIPILGEAKYIRITSSGNSSLKYEKIAEDIVISKPNLSSTKKVTFKNAKIKAKSGFRSSLRAFEISRNLSVHLENITIERMHSGFSIECCKWENPVIRNCIIKNCQVGIELGNMVSNFVFENIDILGCKFGVKIDTSEGDSTYPGGLSNNFFSHCSFEKCGFAMSFISKFGINGLSISNSNFENNLEGDIEVDNLKTYPSIENCTYTETLVENTAVITVILPDGTIIPEVSESEIEKLEDRLHCIYTKSPIPIGHVFKIKIENNYFSDLKSVIIGNREDGNEICDIVFSGNRILGNSGSVDICKDFANVSYHDIHIYKNSCENPEIITSVYSSLSDKNDPNGSYMTRYLMTPEVPENESDDRGSIGDLRWDSKRAYLKTESGWKVIPFIHNFSQTDLASSWRPLETRSTIPDSTEGYNIGDIIWNVSESSDRLGWRLIKRNDQPVWIEIENLL